MERPEFEMILLARVERLERRGRLVAAGWVLSVAVFVLLGVAVQQTVSQPEVIRARRIEVMDATGRARIVLTVDAEGWSGLSLFGTRGWAPIRLAVSPEGTSGLNLYDSARRSRLGIIVVPSGESAIFLWDAAGRALFKAP